MKKIYLLILLLPFFALSCNKTEKKSTKKKTEEKKEVTVVHALDELHERINFKNHDLSLAKFIAKNSSKVSPGKRTIYLQPFGNMKPEVLEILKAEIIYLEAFLQLPVKILTPISFDTIKKVDAVKTRMVPDEEYE